MEKGKSPLSEFIEVYKPTENDIWGKEFDPPYRFIFENQNYNEKETSLLNELKSTEFYEKLDKQYWTDAQLLRWIQGSYYNLKATEKNIDLHNAWRASIIPNKYLKDTVNQYLVL